MAELADALDLGSSAREGVGVQVSPGARRISEMRTRFSDLVFSYWGNSVVTAAASRVVCGRLPPTLHVDVTPRPAALVLLPPALEPTCSRWRRVAPYLPIHPAPVPPAASSLQ